jgi:ABC-type Mn2+/Zn2+ transport system permease subunit
MLTDPHMAMNYSLVWGGLFSLAGLGLLLFFGRRGEGETARIAAAFALANAAIYIFARYAPFGRNEIEELLHGEIQFLGLHEFEMVAVTCACVAVLLGLFHKDLLLVSYDSDSARILKKSVLGFEALLLVLVALLVSVGTMTLGPTLLFGLLVLPPLSARRFARSMRQFQLLSAAGGLFSVVAGVVLSFELDLPLGAAIVASGGLLLLPGFVLRTPRA